MHGLGAGDPGELLYIVALNVPKRPGTLEVSRVVLLVKTTLVMFSTSTAK